MKKSILSAAFVGFLALAAAPAFAGGPHGGPGGGPSGGPSDCGCGGIDLTATNNAPVLALQGNLTAFNYKGDFSNAAVGAVQSLDIVNTNLSELPAVSATATNNAPVVAGQINVTGFNAKTTFSNTAIGVQQATTIKAGY